MRKALWLIFLLISFFLLSELPVEAARGMLVVSDLSHKSGKLGAYWALIIGINDYKDPKIPDLETAVKDARAMAELLCERYGFQVKLLLDRKATKEAIYQALRNLASSTKSDDSVLIYYAGHGDLDRTYDDGWWIPVDAKGGNPLTYLDNGQVQKALRSMKARHVLLISDSCYSGTLFGQARAMPPIIDDKYYLNLYNEKSRWGMTSGNKTPVSDRGTDGHSIFAYQLLKELSKNDKPYFSTQELYTRIAPIISNNSEQTPLCRPIRNTGDQGGEFVFIASSGIKREERLKQEKTQSESLASIPKTAVNSSDNSMVDSKLDSEKRYSLAVFPFGEIGVLPSSLENQKKYIDFIIKYTSDIPSIILTHSFYPYNKDYTNHQIKSIKQMINKNIEKKIWYISSRSARKEPDFKILKELSKKINSGLILTFKMESEISSASWNNASYRGYLVDIENNISFKETYLDDDTVYTKFGIVEMMTKKLFESYLNSNPQIGR